MARKTTAEMISEGLREVGVLLLVFMPLERILVRGEALSLPFMGVVGTIVVITFGAGLWIERHRSLEE